MLGITVKNNNNNVLPAQFYHSYPPLKLGPGWELGLHIDKIFLRIGCKLLSSCKTKDVD